jgi:hypothetical protein
MTATPTDSGARPVLMKPRPDPRVVTEPQPSSRSDPPSTENPDADAHAETDEERRLARAKKEAANA